jgi:hypothetical protein
MANYHSGQDNTHYCRASSPTHTSKTYDIDKEPVLGFDSILVKEKGSTDESLVREIRCEICNPPEHVETSTSLEHEECDCLLCEQAHYDSTPLDMRPVLGCRPKSELKYDKTEHRDCAITIVRALVP